jgi:hypothetical protein
VTRSLGLAVIGMGVLLIWAGWANVNPWDELRAAFVPVTARPLDHKQPTKAKA